MYHAHDISWHQPTNSIPIVLKECRLLYIYLYTSYVSFRLARSFYRFVSLSYSAFLSLDPFVFSIDCYIAHPWQMCPRKQQFSLPWEGAIVQEKIRNTHTHRGSEKEIRILNIDDKPKLCISVYISQLAYNKHETELNQTLHSSIYFSMLYCALHMFHLSQSSILLIQFDCIQCKTGLKRTRTVIRFIGIVALLFSIQCLAILVELINLHPLNIEKPIDYYVYNNGALWVGSRVQMLVLSRSIIHWLRAWVN